tara:strand:- start:82 stop:357 length:276 start_codon:yes stop_codon:yes gene_type:complete
MFTKNIIKDFAKVAKGTISTFGAIKDELDTMIQQRMEKFLNSKGLVTKEECDMILDRLNKLEMKYESLSTLINKSRKNNKTSNSKATSRKI